MHPIERLRYVARASGAPQGALVQETAAALASFGSDPQGLVTACRRIVSRQPTSGPLLWLAARVLTAGDPGERDLGRRRRGPGRPDRPRSWPHALPDDAPVTVLGWPDEIGEALPRRGDVEVLAIDTRGEASGLVSRLWQADVEATDVRPAGTRCGGGRQRPLVLLESAGRRPRRRSWP